MPTGVAVLSTIIKAFQEYFTRLVVQKSGTVRSVSALNEQITMLIAHRLSTILHANTIFVFEKGKIIETGNHDTLVARKGLYYAMWRQQIGERQTGEYIAKPDARQLVINEVLL